jgi:peptide methionine sulfoxide reductase MsrA
LPHPPIPALIPQYRFAIFDHTEEQQTLALQAVKVRGRLGSWVAIEPASDFYRAEEYHHK